MDDDDARLSRRVTSPVRMHVSSVVCHASVLTRLRWRKMLLLIRATRARRVSLRYRFLYSIVIINQTRRDDAVNSVYDQTRCDSVVNTITIAQMVNV
jgi:hypothetical protein